MRIVAIALSAVVMLSLGVATATASDDPAAVATRLAADPPTNLDDYFALKAAMGKAGMEAVRSAAWGLALVQAGVKPEPGHTYQACILPGWSDGVLAGLDLAATVPDRATWTTKRAQIETALSKRAQTLEDIMAGAPLPAPYAAMAAAVKAAKDETDPRSRAIALRVAKDQFARLSVIMVVDRQTLWASGLDADVRAYLGQATGWCDEDRANTAWLKADLRAHGWPKISDLGAATDGRAWLLVQHADHDPAFQREVLAMLERLLTAKDTSPRNYAMLYDRVAVADERPQRYGTQGVCTGPNRWEPRPVEDLENLEKRRAELAMPPMADEVVANIRFCP